MQTMNITVITPPVQPVLVSGWIHQNDQPVQMSEMTIVREKSQLLDFPKIPPIQMVFMVCGFSKITHQEKIIGMEHVTVQMASPVPIIHWNHSQPGVIWEVAKCQWVMAFTWKGSSLPITKYLVSLSKKITEQITMKLIQPLTLTQLLLVTQVCHFYNVRMTFSSTV